ncbi:MAG: hypothetical protein JNL10_14065 [Verrucomicrobiales bacterium]|nr:hypothetical protein [Verrucomicrobiales bacterium]
MTPSPDPCQTPEAGAGTGTGRRRVLRICWGGFRFCVRSGYFFIALLGYALIHLAYIGLPGFLKEPVLDIVREQGLELDYSRIRYVPVRGLVADQVNIRIRGESDRKPLLVRELRFRFDWRPLLRFSPPRLGSISLSGGSAARSIEGAPGEPSAVLRLEDLSGEIEFGSDNAWRLTWLNADVNGVTVEAMGSLSEVSRQLGRKRPAGQSADFRNPALARTLNEMDRMEFTDPPRVELQFAVNGGDLPRSVVQFRGTTAGARGSFGQFDGIRLSVDIQPARNLPGCSHTAVHFQSEAAHTRWGALDSLRFHLDADWNPTNALPESARWTLAARSLVHELGRLGRLQADGVTVARPGAPTIGGSALALDPSRTVARREAPAGPGFATDLELTALEVHTRWGAVSNLVLGVHGWNPVDEWRPAALDWRLRAEDATADQARLLRIEWQGSALPVPPKGSPEVTGFWTNLAPWRVQTRVTANDVHVSPRHSADHLDLILDWSQGTLRLEGLDVRSPAGVVAGNAWVSATNGDAGLRLRGSVEPLRLGSVLPPEVWRSMTNRGIHEGSSLQFDLWANSRLPGASWESAESLREVGKSLTARGEIRSTNFGVGGLTVHEVRIPFDVTPESLRVEGLTVAIPSGTLMAGLEAAPESGDWRVSVNGALNPLEIAALFRSPGLDAQLDLVGITDPPWISGEVRGRLGDPDRTGAVLKVALTNATYRGESITELRTTVTYTNLQLSFAGIELFQGTNVARVPSMRYDIPARLLYITNGFSTLNVAGLVRAIGPKTAKVLAPYQFLEAPTVRVNGAIPVMDDVTGSVVFQASVPRFQWWYFEFENLLATVGWEGEHLSITNVAGGFYGGLVSANVGVNVHDRDDAVFHFNASYADVDLSRLIADLTMSTNRLEGTLSGEVTVLEGHGRQDRPWKGYGNAQLRNGYLWDLPLFGLMSPAFESVSPGLGTAKFRDGNALFTITNRSVDFSRVELLSPAMRLQMRGPVDFDGRLRLVLEAEPLRDVPLFGPLVNLVLSPFTKLLEYDITGTLEKPEAELRHVPSFLLIPLQPFHTLKSVFKSAPPPPPKSPPSPAPSPSP